MGAAYVVAVFAMLFSGVSALTLIHTFRSFDRPEAEKPQHATV